MSVWQLSTPSEQSAHTNPDNTQNQYGENSKHSQLSFNDLPADFSLRYYFVRERTLFISEVLMYGSAQCVMPFCNTFSMRATRKISAWGLVTEKIACRKKKEWGGHQSWVMSFCLLLQPFKEGAIFCKKKKKIKPFFHTFILVSSLSMKSKNQSTLLLLESVFKHAAYKTSKFQGIRQQHAHPGVYLAHQLVWGTTFFIFLLLFSGRFSGKASLTLT